MSENGPITVKRSDYGRVTGVLFKFGEVTVGFQVPDSITVDEMVKVLGKTAKALHENKSVIFMPDKYFRERSEEIKKMQEEEQEEKK